MRVPDTLIRVSGSAIREKVFGVTEAQLREKFPEGPDLDEALSLLPTEEEQEFMEIYQSSMPQLARLRRKLSVCLEAEVTEMSEDVLVYEFAGKSYRLESPKNAFRICTAVEKGTPEGFAEMVAQGCVSIDGKALTDVRGGAGLAVDELRLMMSMADRFFFQTYLG